MKPLEHLVDEARESLVRVLGEELGTEVLAKARQKAGVGMVATPVDLLQLADRLIEAGGFTEVVGRALKVQALLRGARVSATGVIHTLDRH